jgi:hypothetical protein
VSLCLLLRPLKNTKIMFFGISTIVSSCSSLQLLGVHKSWWYLWSVPLWHKVISAHSFTQLIPSCKPFRNGQCAFLFHFGFPFLTEHEQMRPREMLTELRAPHFYIWSFDKISWQRKILVDWKVNQKPVNTVAG